MKRCVNESKISPSKFSRRWFGSYELLSDSALEIGPATLPIGKLDDSIGGYLSLSLDKPQSQSTTSITGVPLHCGRACISMLLRNSSVKRAFLPFYCCDALVEPFRNERIPVEFFEIDTTLQPLLPLELSHGEVAVIINYFGLIDVEHLASKSPDNIWIDDSQGFFSSPRDSKFTSFTSARKFFAVPDGGFLHSSLNLKEPNDVQQNCEYHTEHLLLRSLGYPERGLVYFRRNEVLRDSKVRSISEFSKTLLAHTDLSAVRKARRANYLELHNSLKAKNQIHESIEHLGPNQVPLCYPFLPVHPIPREYLFERKIFVPSFWSDCAERGVVGFDWEKDLSRRLLPLPIDQRYGNCDMRRVVDAIEAFDG